MKKLVQENTYLNRCCDCKRLFETANRRERKCPECKKLTKARKLAREYEQRKKPQKPLPEVSIFECVRIIESYNKEHGTYLSYGQFMVKLNCGEIRIKKPE